MRSIAKGMTALVGVMALTGCVAALPQGEMPSDPGVRPMFTYAVTNNDTPYSKCLASLNGSGGNNLPVFAVGEVSDKTGQFQNSGNQYSTVLTQGVAEMVMSALNKTGKARLVERYDLRIPLAEMKMVEQNLVDRSGAPQRGGVRRSDFVVVGALTELNYNIVSQGARLAVAGIGGGARSVVINVALDMRVVNSRTFDVNYVTSLQKQIYGFEVEANVFRFFGTQLVEFDAGRIQNEPLQLGVRSVVEMAVYQIMTDFLRLPSTPECELVQAGFMSSKPTG